MTRLENRFHDELEKAAPVSWTPLTTDRVAGEVRSAGGGGYTAGNVTFVQIYEAGYAGSHLRAVTLADYCRCRHMAPYDQPEALLVST